MNKKGQATVEYVLMVGAVVTFLLTAMTLFHKQLISGFFTIIGGILG